MNKWFFWVTYYQWIRWSSSHLDGTFTNLTESVLEFNLLISILLTVHRYKEYVLLTVPHKYIPCLQKTSQINAKNHFRDKFTLLLNTFLRIQPWSHSFFIILASIFFKSSPSVFDKKSGFGTSWYFYFYSLLYLLINYSLLYYRNKNDQCCQTHTITFNQREAILFICSLSHKDHQIQLGND